MTIQITNSAADKFKQMTTDPKIVPRIEIASGGCNGFEKKFSMGPIYSDDIIIKLPNGASIVIDRYSHDMLDESTVDYKQGLTGNYFTIEIPEATSSCGCGSSFSL
jgi:iron-sulfur cluster insertion protein